MIEWKYKTKTVWCYVVRFISKTHSLVFMMLKYNPDVRCCDWHKLGYGFVGPRDVNTLNLKHFNLTLCLKQNFPHYIANFPQYVLNLPRRLSNETQSMITFNFCFLLTLFTMELWKKQITFLITHIDAHKIQIMMKNWQWWFEVEWVTEIVHIHFILYIISNLN